MFHCRTRRHFSSRGWVRRVQKRDRLVTLCLLLSIQALIDLPSVFFCFLRVKHSSLTCCIVGANRGSTTAEGSEGYRREVRPLRRAYALATTYRRIYHPPSTAFLCVRCVLCGHQIYELCQPLRKSIPIRYPSETFCVISLPAIHNYLRATL